MPNKIVELSEIDIDIDRKLLAQYQQPKQLKIKFMELDIDEHN
jgi:hypothetical protein